MTLKDYADSSFWFWPVFYAGFGFAQASILIAICYFVFSIRKKIVDGEVGKVIGETLIILLSFPSLAALFALIEIMVIAHGKNIPDSIFFGIASAAITILGAFFLMPQSLKSEIKFSF